MNLTPFFTARIMLWKDRSGLSGRRLRGSAMLFCNVGYMEKYQGQTKADTIKGGGSWVAEHGTGHEVCNFLPVNGKVYGYVQAMGSGIDVERLGADKVANFVDGIDVVWTANKPGVGTVVVGWYRNARVHGPFKKFDPVPLVQAANGIAHYLIEARASDATLLEVDARVLEVPRRQKGGMGQSNVWYADQPGQEAFLARVARALRNGAVPPAPQAIPGGRATPDHALKVKVEKSAIRMTWTHYEKLGYVVESVEADNVGWDLEAVSGKTKLRIEVKGLSGNGQQIELSPNEYKAFSAQASDYRLAIVSEALTPKARLALARFSVEFGRFVIESDEKGVVSFEPKTGAIVRFA